MELLVGAALPFFVSWMLFLAGWFDKQLRSFGEDLCFANGCVSDAARKQGFCGESFFHIHSLLDLFFTDTV